MHCFAACHCGSPGQYKSDHEADQRIDHETDAAPFCAAIELRIALISRAEYMPRGAESEEHPHTEEPEPGEDLNQRKLLHRRRHLANRAQYLCKHHAKCQKYLRRARAPRFAPLPAER